MVESHLSVVGHWSGGCQAAGQVLSSQGQATPETLQVRRETMQSSPSLLQVMEAQMHFDFPNAPWVYRSAKEYTPGAGMAFGLGMYQISTRQWIFTANLALQARTRLIKHSFYLANLRP